MEQLEARCLLDAGPLYISEFMAKNKTKYENNAGNDTDWLEVYNPTPSPVTLGSATAGQSYFLTNDATDLTMWAFPAGVSLAAGAYMVVNCDTTPSGGTGAYTNVATVGPWAAGTTQYYAGFGLSAAGGYVALVQPDGQTIASQYNYPKQLSDVSYGMITTASSTSLVGAGSSVKYLVPTASTYSSSWASPAYSDASWSTGVTGLGYGPTYTPPTITAGSSTGWGQFGTGSTWNYYVPMSANVTWEVAEAYAATQTFGGKTGHLAVIRSAAESAYLWGLVGNTSYWTGLTNSSASPFNGTDYGSEVNNPVPNAGTAPTATNLPITGITHNAAVATATMSTKCSTLGLAVGDCVCISGATPAAYDGVGITTSGPYFEITAFPTAYSFSYTMQSTPTSIASGTITGIMPQKGYGFVWCDGALVDPFTYQAWPTNQPNNSSGGATPANYVQAQSSSGSWDDRADANNNTLCPYVIEFNTQLAAPPGGTSGTDYGNFSVTEVHSSSSLSSLSAGMNLLSNPGSNTVTKSTGGAIEYDDPDNVAAGHYNGFAFVGNTSGADHNFVDYVKGTIQIPTTGTYTFDVNSSDWFSLTIDPTTPSATAPAFLTAAGTHYGTGTTVSGNTLTNSGASAHTVADAGGQIALTAGTYPIDLYYVAGATNAPRLELLAASGALAAYSASFRLIGDTGSGDGGLSVVGISSPAATSQVGTNLQSAMQNVNATALVRIPFSVDDPTQCTQLTLSMEYDDGFVAYLNGTQVLSVNAPASPAWNSTATAVHGSGDATRYESFNLSSDQSLLVGGTNVLAIQGLNYSSSDSDFLVLPQLQYGSININNIEYFTTPTPGATNVPGNLGIVPNIDFGVSDGFYTAPFYTSLTDSSSAATIAYTLDGRTPVIPTIGTAETISGITASGTNNLTATVTTASAHGYYTGEQVEIAGVTPTQFDGVFNISVLSPTTFTYTMLSTPSGSALGAMTAALIPVSTVNSRTITSITYGGTGLSNTTATVTCTGHGYSNGELIQISGASPWQYNGIFTITTLNPSTGLAVDANTFYYTMSSAPSTSASGTLLAAAVSTLTYTGPIYINSTTTLRAEAYEAGYFTSHLDTASYIFMNDVINQPQIFTDDPANYFYSLNQTCVKDPSFNSNNYPTMWTGIDGGDTEPHGNSPTTEGQYQDLYSADYQMDPEVVTDPNYASTIISDMQTIPTLSLVMNPDDWFGEGSSGTNGIRGIYVNSAQTDPNGATSPQWKRECSAELINPDGSVGFQINASIKMHGGGSAQPTKEVEHSFTLGFTNDYDGPLNYPFFGPSGEQSFNELTLRAGYNDSWTHGTESQRQYGSYLQEEFANAELAALGGPDRHGNWVNLYINGIYWGLYNPTEYPDSNFSAAYQGGNTADWDTIKVSETGPPVPDDGDPYAWNTLYNIAETGSLGSPTVCPGTGTNTIAMATPAAFNLIQQYLNVPEFIDYMLVEYYGSNNDWDNHNWIAVRDSRFNGVATNAFGGFEFVNWDGERTLEGTGDNVMNVSALNGGMAGTPATEDFGPGFLFQQLKVNPEFQVMWANATHKDLYNNGPLSASGATTIYAAASQQIDRAIVGQSARWGDYHRDINYGGPGNGMWSPPAYLYTRNGLAASSYLLAGNTTTKFNNADDPNYPSNTPDTWIGNQNRMFNTYFPVRTANVITEFQNDLVYPLSSTAAPEFSSLPTGGYTASGLVSFNSIGAGAIYYTTDGTDPRVPNIASPVPVYGTPSFVKSIWLNGTTATVRVPNHGYANGETVAISGATPSNYDGNFVIGNVTQDTFTIPVTGSPAAATGTIVCQPYGISPTSTGAIVWLPSNGLAVGNKVLMSGAVQQPALNGVFVVTAVTANTFSFALTGVSLDTSDTAVTAQRVDVAVSGITYSGATATVTTATANTYSTGNLVRILGASVATFNGDFLITWLSSTQFQYTMSTTPSGSPTGTMAAVNVVSPSAHKYTFGVSITLPSPATRIRARVLNGTIWSALNDAWFTTHPAAAAGNLAITEINYDPLDPTAAELAANPAYTDNDFQFVEIQNIGTQTIDLTGVQLWIGYQLAFSFTGSAVTTLAPGAFVLVAQNSAALAQRYGSSVTPLVAGTFLQDFDHGGDRVVLTDRLGNTIEDFTFNNGGAWPGRAGGSGSTLEILNPTDDPTDPNNWHSSLDYQGSPGRSGTAAPDGVVINEILCNTQFINGVGNYGSIELYNTNSTPVDVSGWYLTDSLSDLDKFCIPAGTVLGAGQYKVFDDRDFNLAPYSLNTNGVVDESTDTDGVTPLLQIQGDTVNELTERRIILPANCSIVAGQDMVLKFDFKSHTEGVVQGIGLDSGDTGASSVLYRIFGTGTLGTQVTNANGYYSTLGAWQTYTIDLGSSLSTAMNRLFFYIDDAAATGAGFVGADEWFRNVSISVSGTASPPTINWDQYFGLNGAHGGSVWLVKANSSGTPLEFEDHATYNQAPDPVVNGTPQPQAQGCWPNGTGNYYALSSWTPGTGANSLPYVGPALPNAGWLVISEVMYDPPNPVSGLDGQQLEYLKIYNAGTTTVDLTNWRLRGGISFDFASGQTLAPGASLVVVPFDPVNNPDALSRFEARYSGVGSSQLVGPYSGALGNGGDTVDLERPGTPLTSDLTYTPHWIEDEVAYGTSAPWPVLAAGLGDSLQRNLTTIGWGDAATSWTAGSPTLGLLETAPAGVTATYTNSTGNPLVVGAPGVLTNDSPPTGLSALLIDPPEYAGLAFNASNGSFTYTPYNGYHGPDSFTYKAQDSQLLSHTTTVLINPPLAGSHAYQAVENTALLIPAGTGVLFGASDQSGYHLMADVITPPAYGALTLNGDGSFTYVPTSNYVGPDSFTYAANDGVIDSVAATVNITVNAPPVANNDSYVTDTGVVLSVPAPGVLSNDTGSGTLTAVKVSGPFNGNLALNANGSFTYTPNTGYTGTDSFTYQASNGVANSNTATVSIAVHPLPVATADSYATNVGVLLSVAAPGVLSNDTGSGTLTAVKMTGPSHGNLALNANGSFTYSPTSGYAGQDSFTYVANDGVANSLPATVTLNVTGTLTVSAGNWTDGGLTLMLQGDGLLHVVHTDTGLDAVSPQSPANVTAVAITGRDNAADALTIDFSQGNPIPSGGVTFEGGAGGNADSLSILDAGGSAVLGAGQLTVNPSSVISFHDVQALSFALGAGTLDLGGNTQTSPAITLVSGQVTDGTLSSSAYVMQSGAVAASLTGSGALTKTGAGTVTLSGSNNFLGGTTVAGGTLSVSISAALPPAGAVTLAGGNLVLNFAAGGGTVVPASAPSTAVALDISQPGASETSAPSASAAVAVPAFVATQTAAVVPASASSDPPAGGSVTFRTTSLFSGKGSPDSSIIGVPKAQAAASSPSLGTAASRGSAANARILAHDMVLQKETIVSRPQLASSPNQDGSPSVSQPVKTAWAESNLPWRGLYNLQLHRGRTKKNVQQATDQLLAVAMKFS